MFFAAGREGGICKMNWEGIVIGAVSFLVIGLFHPIVIKCEYHLSKKAWPLFLVAGIVFAGLSLAFSRTLWSAVLGVTSFSCFWSILELYEQEKRVQKGWFPANPKRASSQAQQKEPVQPEGEQGTDPAADREKQKEPECAE